MVEDLVFMHSNLCLVSRRGEEYATGLHKEWDVDAECRDLELSLGSLDIGDQQLEVELPLLPIHALVLLNMHLVRNDEDDDQYDIY